MDKYVVVIVGYEGIEEMFGVFDKEEAISFTITLKQKAPGRYSLEADQREVEKRREALEKELGLDYMCTYTTDQVCIMTTKNTRLLECCCDILPKEYRNKEPWFY